MKRFVFASLLVALIGIASVPSTQAATTVNATFPDTSVGQVQTVGGNIAFIFYDWPGDSDIFTVHVNSFGNPVGLRLSSDPILRFSYWLDWLGFSGGLLLYNVWATTGGAYFLLGSILL